MCPRDDMFHRYDVSLQVCVILDFMKEIIIHVEMIAMSILLEKYEFLELSLSMEVKMHIQVQHLAITHPLSSKASYGSMGLSLKNDVA